MTSASHSTAISRSASMPSPPFSLADPAARGWWWRCAFGGFARTVQRRCDLIGSAAWACLGFS